MAVRMQFRGAVKEEFDGLLVRFKATDTSSGVDLVLLELVD